MDTFRKLLLVAALAAVPATFGFSSTAFAGESCGCESCECEEECDCCEDCGCEDGYECDEDVCACDDACACDGCHAEH